MFKNRFHRLSLLTLALVLGLGVVAPSKAADMKPEDIVAKHLDSIGPAQARAAAKSRVVEGTVTYKILVGGAGNLDGKSVLVSQDQKLHFMMKLNNNLYHGEQFVFDGNKDEISFSTANQTRSPFGEFIRVQDVILREGLLGGTLSTAWPLYDLSDRKAKLSYEGMRKMDGKDCYELRFRPKKSTDTEILLYFDTASFHHVATVYSVRIRPQLANVDPNLASAVPSDPSLAGPQTSPTGAITTGVKTGVPGETSETATARQQETRYRLEEHFDSFEAIGGLTLPTHYTIHFSQELGSGRTTVSEWAIITTQTTNGDGVDARNFQVK